MILSMVGVLAVELLSGRAFKPMRPVTDDMVPEKVTSEPELTGSPRRAVGDIGIGAVNAPPLAPRMDDLLADPRPAFRDSSATRWRR